MSLFPNAAARNELPLVQFKAGICNIAPQENGSFLVTPDPRKGLITMKREADRLLHFKWTDRTTNTVVKDLIVNSDVAFKRVRTGTPSDRVYILKWIAGDHRMMFWLQDKRTDNDTENCEKVNRLLTGNDQTNNEPGGDLMRMLRGGNRAPIPMNNATGGLDLGRIIQGIQFAGNNQPAASTATATAAAGSSTAGQSQGALSADALRAAMAGMATQPQQSQQQQSTTASRPEPTNLNRVLSADSVLATGILNDPEVRRGLIALLPESQQSEEYLEETLRSPQVQQSIDLLSAALQSDNYQTVMGNFSLDPSVGLAQLMRGDAIGAFLAAAIARGNQTRETQPQPEQQQQQPETEEKMEEEKKEEKKDDDDFYS